MTFLRRLRQYRVYRRLVLSYLLLSVATISVLSVVLYALFSDRAVKEAGRSSRQMLTQVGYTSDVVYEQVQRITGQLLSDPVILSFLYAKEDDKTVAYAANLFLARIQGIYPFIQNLGIYNLTTGAYIDTLGLTPDPGMARREETSPVGFFPRTVSSLGGSTYRMLTFKIIPERSFENAPESAIVVDLDESYIRSTMRRIGGSSRTFVMDASGTVLSHSDPALFMNDLAASEYVRRILSDPNAEGSFRERIDGEKQLVTYVRSPALDWYFVSVRPYAETIAGIDELRDWTIFAAALLALAGAGGSLLLSGTIYNPIRALLDKVHPASGAGQSSLLRLDEYQLLSEAFSGSMEEARTMRSSLERTRSALLDGYMVHLLRGNASKFEASAELKREAEKRLAGASLTVVLLKIDSFKTFRETTGAYDRGLYRFAVRNIAQEILGRSYTVAAAHPEEDETALILVSDAEKPDGQLLLSLGEVQDAVRRYYRLSLSAGIGDPAASLGEISGSYQSAREYLTSRLFLGHGCAATARTMPEERDRRQVRYPSAAEKRLLEAIRLCRRTGIRQEVAAFRSALAGCSYGQAVRHIQLLALAIVREFEPMAEGWNVDEERLYRLADEVRDAETLDEVEKRLTILSFAVVDMLEDNRKNLGVTKNAKIVEEVQRFVREHYAEHGLSLEAAAEHAGYSSGYVGKLFKSMTGTSFNDYVTHVRMERAKELLAETNDPVAQIGERVGVYNVPYFTTLFKKKYGITPSKFREQAPF